MLDNHVSGLFITSSALPSIFFWNPSLILLQIDSMPESHEESV